MGRNALGSACLRGEKLYLQQTNETTQHIAFCGSSAPLLSAQHTHVTTQQPVCAYDSLMPPLIMSHVHTSVGTQHGVAARLLCGVARWGAAPDNTVVAGSVEPQFGWRG